MTKLLLENQIAVMRALLLDGEPPGIEKVRMRSELAVRIAATEEALRVWDVGEQQSEDALRARLSAIPVPPDLPHVERPPLGPQRCECGRYMRCPHLPTGFAPAPPMSNAERGARYAGDDAARLLQEARGYERPRDSHER
jgi:hypothetical protein